MTSGTGASRHPFRGRHDHLTRCNRGSQRCGIGRRPTTAELALAALVRVVESFC